MVRQFLGNIRGPMGPEGPSGPEGGFNGESIGGVNLLDFHNIETYQNTGQVEYDMENGVIRYDNLSFYFVVYKKLKPKKYHFYVHDYTSHSSVYGGRFRLRIEGTSGTPIFNQDIRKNLITEVDLSDDVERVYEIRFYVSSSDTLDGFIEKPMLTDAEYPVLWSPSPNDIRNNQKGIVLSARITGQIEYSSGLTEHSPLRLSGANELYDEDNMTINLDSGRYRVVFAVTPNVFSNGTYEVALRNGDNVLTAVRGYSPNTVNINDIIELDERSSLSIYANQNVREDPINVRASQTSNIYIEKI